MEIGACGWPSVIWETGAERGDIVIEPADVVENAAEEI